MIEIPVVVFFTAVFVALFFFWKLTHDHTNDKRAARHYVAQLQDEIERLQDQLKNR